jgi:uncharacterized protein
MDTLTAIGRHPERGHYDFDTIATILDGSFVCQIGFTVDGQPVVLPTIYARAGDVVYVHGSSLARWLSNIDGAEICFSVTRVDAIVFARSAFHHSLNYRSVVAFGRAQMVRDPQEKLAALTAVVEAVQPGRWDDVRQPSDGELQATTVLRIPLDRASAKVRNGPPADAPADYTSDFWAGLVPLEERRGAPIPDPKLHDGISVPAYLLSRED